jgi:predicted TIM-barrel fold metal-dependent hydrolase
LLFSGTLSRCPNIRWIFSHGGGALPMLAGRIVGLARNRPELAARVPNGVMTELKKLYYDVVGVHSRGAFAALKDIADPTHLLFGTDFPFWSPHETVEALEKLSLPATELAAIERGNALALLPGLKIKN